MNVKKSLKVYLVVIRQSKNKRSGQTDLTSVMVNLILKKKTMSRSIWWKIRTETFIPHINRSLSLPFT